MAKEAKADTRTDRNVRTVATPVPVAVPTRVAPAQAQPVAPAASQIGRNAPAPAQPPPAASSAAAQTPTNADITSESNYNQAKTPQEHRDAERKATDEATAQQKSHPGGVPLPTSGQPVTKPEPDQQ